MKECQHEWRKYIEFLDYHIVNAEFCVKCGIDKNCYLIVKDRMRNNGVKEARGNAKD